MQWTVVLFPTPAPKQSEVSWRLFRVEMQPSENDLRETDVNTSPRHHTCRSLGIRIHRWYIMSCLSSGGWAPLCTCPRYLGDSLHGTRASLPTPNSEPFNWQAHLKMCILVIVDYFPATCPRGSWRTFSTSQVIPWEFFETFWHLQDSPFALCQGYLLLRKLSALCCFFLPSSAQWRTYLLLLISSFVWASVCSLVLWVAPGLFSEPALLLDTSQRVGSCGRIVHGCTGKTKCRKSRQRREQGSDSCNYSESSASVREGHWYVHIYLSLCTLDSQTYL